MFKKEVDQKAEDHLLLRQLNAGSMLAFDAIYQKYWEVVYNAAFKRLKNESVSKDITQDIFLQLWQRRETLLIDHLPSYLYTSVRNNVLKIMEKEHRYTPISTLVEQAAASSEQPDSAVLLREFTVRYEALVGSMTPAQQEIFRLRYAEDMGTLEIAERLNIARKTVQNQLGKSVSLLKHIISAFFLFYFG